MFFIFQKKKPENTLPVLIKLFGDGFSVNGKQFTIPARISELIEILGEPRIVVGKNDAIKAAKERVCKNYNLPPKRYAEADFYWDDLGLLASTYDKKTVHCFWIKIGDAKKYPMKMPKYDFSGTLLIYDRPWQEVAMEKANHPSGTFYMKLGTLHAYVIRYGSKVECIKQFQIGLNDDQEFTFFDD